MAKRKKRIQEPATPAPTRRTLGAREQVFIVAFLLIATAAVYAPVFGHDFVNFDDQIYVTDNEWVQSGFNRESVRRAFGHYASNWAPLTLLSHIADAQLFGLDPRGHHATSLLFHLANTWLVFFVLKRTTGSVWKSAAVALVFGVHPLHVESVAWISERKDVLSTFFALLAIVAYTKYVERPALPIYGLVAVLFACGLMAKAMLVTFPFMLLLLDIWPLKRISLTAPLSRAIPARVLWEKLPLLLLTVVFSVVTFDAQEVDGAVSNLETFSLEARLENTLISYAFYLGKTIWPSNLAVLYPHPGDTTPWGPVAAAALLLAAISAGAIARLRRAPYFFVGWFWFVGTLVPVIGLIQVGSQGRADRYMYIPLIGLCIAGIWGAAELATRVRLPRLAARLALGIAAIPLMAAAYNQTRYWENGVTLFSRAVAVSGGNHLLHDYLGMALANEERFSEAIAQYRASVKYRSDYPDAHHNLGAALANAGDARTAVEHYREALRLDPTHRRAHANLGNALQQLGETDAASEAFARAVELDPSDDQVHYNLALLLAQSGKLEASLPHFEAALRLEPDFVRARNNLGNALAALGRAKEAEAAYRETLRRAPDHASARYNLARLLAEQGELEQARNELEHALEVDPGNAKAEQLLRAVERSQLAVAEGENAS